jgi:hypothetical protein
MMARCEFFRLSYIHHPYTTKWQWNEREKRLHQMNRYYSELQRNYPEYADELISGCELFRELFEKRRAAGKKSSR